jgi:peptide/nickel transport system substrate-binding protein
MEEVLGRTYGCSGISVRIPRFSGAAALLLASLVAVPALAAKEDNSIRFATEQVLENADPYFNNQRTGIIVAHQVWDTLIYRDPKTNEYKGQLATAWKWVDDRTIELELRQGVRFHNGAEFDADDVVYTLNFVSRPESRVVARQNVDWIERAERLDRYKVRIVAKRPFPAAIDYLAGPIMIHPHEYYRRVGPRGMNEKPIGSGPYRVAEHALGKSIRLQRNPDYFKDSPKPQPTIDRIEIRFIPDTQTQVAEVLAEGLDIIMNVSADQAQHLRRMPNLQVAFGETMRIMFLQLDTTERTQAPQLLDIRVRKAILHAIDRDAMIGSIVGEGARGIHTVCFPAQFGCTDAGAPRYAYDVAKAKQLLAEAGLSDGFELDLYAFRERGHAEAIVGYLRAIGIRANLRYMQYAAVREALRAGKVPMVLVAWGSFSVNDVSASTSVFYKFAPDDISRDPEVRDLLERGDSSVEPIVRKEVYAKALALIQERAYALPLYSLPMYYAAAKDLVFTAHPDEIPRFWEMSWK